MASKVTELRAAVVNRVRNGPGEAESSARRAAFDAASLDGLPSPLRALLEKIARAAWTVSDEDVSSVKAANVPEDQIFELAVSAALGQATRQLDAARAALDAATASTTKKGSR